MPRAGLSPRAVVDIALDVVDDGGPSGWADLALSTVAHRAGVAVPSLYKHVDGLPALRSAVAARCVEDLTAAMTKAVTVSGTVTGPAGADPAGGLLRTTLTGAEAVRALAVAIRSYALTHPGRYRAVQSAETAAHAPTASFSFNSGPGSRPSYGINATGRQRPAGVGAGAAGSAG